MSFQLKYLGKKIIPQNHINKSSITIEMGVMKAGVCSKEGFNDMLLRKYAGTGL